jgi:hypothetical protein
MTNSLEDQISLRLFGLIDGQADTMKLNEALRLLSKWRSILIQNTILKHQGTVVMQGPFAGLDFIRQSSEGCHVAKLLGSYEQPLQPFVVAALKAKYQTILNIGCAEGYYAVGMALNMTETQVLAFDLDPIARETCKSLALKNKVSERLSIGGLFKPEDFASYTNQKVLVFCDIEGGEKDLLDPNLAPALAYMDLIVESHECLIPGLTNSLIDRFKNTHVITVVQDDGQRSLQSPPQWFLNLAHLDQLLATWEWRSGATPWLVMKAKNTSHQQPKLG